MKNFNEFLNENNLQDLNENLNEAKKLQKDTKYGDALDRIEELLIKELETDFQTKLKFLTDYNISKKGTTHFFEIESYDIVKDMSFKQAITHFCKSAKFLFKGSLKKNEKGEERIVFPYTYLIITDFDNKKYEIALKYSFAYDLQKDKLTFHVRNDISLFNF